MAGIINYFARNRATSASNTNWGKALVIPVEVRTSKDEQNNEVVNRISHYMGFVERNATWRKSIDGQYKNIGSV